jgi:hypothetical protein
MAFQIYHRNWICETVFIGFSCYKLLKIKIYVNCLQNLTLTLNSNPNLNPNLRIMGAEARLDTEVTWFSQLMNI